MYEFREDIFDVFEREEDDAKYENLQSPLSLGSSQEGSRKPTSLSYATFTPAAGYDSEDEIYFPSYDQKEEEYAGRVETIDEEEVEDDDDDVLVEVGLDVDAESESSSSRTTSPELPDPIERSGDDTDAHVQPSRHVDYLSHDWSEEELWLSYKYLVSKRKVYSNCARLENACWRTWEKKRRDLEVVTPETVKWLKDHDLTWLYGPLQTGDVDTTSCLGASSSSRSILKKQPLSKVMLRRSLSSISLRRLSSRSKSPSSSPHPDPEFALSRAATLDPSPTSQEALPWNSKNVRFHTTVSQCMAVTHIDPESPDAYDSDSDSELDVLMLKSSSSHTNPSPSPVRKASPPPQTITPLPETTLKSPAPETEPAPTGLGLAFRRKSDLTPGPGMVWNDMDDSDDDDAEDSYWSPPPWLPGRKDSVQLFHDRLSHTKPSSRPGLARRNVAVEEDDLHVPSPPAKGSVKFELPPTRAQLADEELEDDYIEFSHNNGDYFAGAQPPLPKISAKEGIASPRSDSGYGSEETGLLVVREARGATLEEEEEAAWEGAF